MKPRSILLFSDKLTRNAESRKKIQKNKSAVPKIYEHIDVGFSSENDCNNLKILFILRENFFRKIHERF